ncbi:hypothetical protein MUK42_11939 [Musa troglodytarum]|uniref:THO1-MOS11 C-terminal domain-containing protein n=1 Tax=Musa troglodytarum TaxID=320322 RepID=A0A9E7KHZ6_9LILI|nr:hypothetical protein MUK42_11939 [Musa troglodytarum]
MVSQNPGAVTEAGKKAPVTPLPSSADPPPSPAAVAANMPALPAACLENPTPAPDASFAPQQPEIHGAGAVAGSSLGLASALEVGPVTDLRKKLRRAERFGMPVMLSEEEKRNSRAERFGTGSPLSGRKDVGQLEEQKRKARAERFGLKIDIIVDEEAKKKARLERFAPKSMMDTSEVEKRKARAIRFSQGSLQVGSQSNYDLKATTVAHA